MISIMNMNKEELINRNKQLEQIVQLYKENNNNLRTLVAHLEKYTLQKANNRRLIN